MTDKLQYLRQVSVVIGPVADWIPTEKKSNLVFLGDGTQDYFRIKFSIHKHKLTTATPTVVQIYNLTEETRSAISKYGLGIVISAGWQNDSLYKLFQGTIMAVKTTRQGPDLVTDIMSLASAGALARKIVNQTWGAKYKLKNTIYDLAKQISNVKVDPKRIIVQNTSFGSQGQSFNCPVTDALDKLARIYGFTWGIDNGVFYAVDDKKRLPGKSPLISWDNGYLLRAEPMLATPFQKTVGVSIKSRLHPGLVPGGSLTLKSQTNPKLNGKHTIHTLMHVGDTHSSEWMSSVESWLTL